MQKRLWECELARFKWNELRIARGTADHVPGALTQLLNAPSPEEADEAYWQLDTSVVVQGQLFESAEAVVRVLLAALAELPLRGVTGALELLFQIVHGQAHEDEPRRDMGEVCRAAAREGAWLLHGL